MRKGFIYGMFGCFGVGVAILLVVIVVAGIAGGSRGASSSPSATPTVATGASPTAPKHWVVIAHFVGSGIKNTETFVVGNRWRFSWKSSERMSIYVEGDHSDIATGETTGQQEEYQAGTYHLSTNSSGTWDITVEDFR